MDTIRIYIVRHGETEENKQKIIQGQLDTPLNSEGEKQANLVAKALRDIPFDVCYSSDLSRAASTAERILVHHSGVRLETPLALRERVCHPPVIDTWTGTLSDEPNSTWEICRVVCGAPSKDSFRAEKGKKSATQKARRQ